jgi:AcrR family transcriptional regulator
MAKIRESSEVVKDRILEVAGRLFALHGIKDVTIRKIAEEAGINHALVIRYFGSKAELVTEILRREISALTYQRPGKPGQSFGLEFLRRILLETLTTHKNTMKLIVRSALDGLSPESYVDQNSERVANKLAKWIESQQAGSSNLPDPKVMSLVINAAMFSLVTNAPWLLSSVGLPPDDFEKQKEAIVDVLVWIIVQAISIPSE